MSETGRGRPFTQYTAWTPALLTPLRAFLRTETGGAAVLLAAAVASLVWVNAAPSSYDSVWHTDLSIHVGDAGIAQDLRGWVNSGLMTLFFFVVGLEARREFDVGELRERRRVTLPLLAGVAGMAAPVLIYLAINAGHGSSGGWGAAMSTDTAFALGHPRARWSAAGRPASRLHVDRGRRGRFRRPACHRRGLHRPPRPAAAAPRGRIVRGGAGRPRGRRPDRRAVRAARRRHLGRAVRVRRRSGGGRARDRAGDVRLSRRPRGPGAGDRALPAVPRATDIRARPTGPHVGGGRGVAERAAATDVPPVDQLCDRAAVRARECGHPDQRRLPGARRHVPDHPGNPGRLRRRQTARHRRHVLARQPAQPGAAAPARRLGSGRRRGQCRRDRVHGSAADLLAGVRGGAAGGREGGGAGRRGRRLGPVLAGVPRARTCCRRCRAPARCWGPR